MECCNKIYKFCETLSPCDLTKLLDLISTIFTTQGDYILKLYFLDTCINYGVSISAEGEFEFADFDELDFNVQSASSIEGQSLNENYFYKGQLFNLDGETVNIIEDYDCFSFKTKYCH